MDAALSSSTALLDCQREPYRSDPQACEKGYRQWITVNRQKVEQAGNPNEAAYSFENGSLYAGIEGLVADNAVVGFAAGYTRSDFAIPTRWMQGSTDHFHAALYGVAAADNGLGIKALLAMGLSSNAYSRYAMGNLVEGDSESFSYGMKLEAFYRGQLGKWNLTPFVAYQTEKLEQFSHEENNVLWGNDYLKEGISSSPVSVGLTIERPVIGERSQFIPKLRYTYKTETDSPERSITAASLAAPGYYWTVNGPDVPKEEHLVDMSLKWSFSNESHVEVQAFKNWSSSYDSHGGSLNFYRKF
jgi:uncharacterized protein with beta-barrel porin domain